MEMALLQVSASNVASNSNPNSRHGQHCDRTRDLQSSGGHFLVTFQVHFSWNSHPCDLHMKINPTKTKSTVVATAEGTPAASLFMKNFLKPDDGI